MYKLGKSIYYKTCSTMRFPCETVKWSQTHLLLLQINSIVRNQPFQQNQVLARLFPNGRNMIVREVEKSYDRFLAFATDFFVHICTSRTAFFSRQLFQFGYSTRLFFPKGKGLFYFPLLLFADKIALSVCCAHVFYS